MNSAASSKKVSSLRRNKGKSSLGDIGETMEDGKNLDSTIEESRGVRESVCIERTVMVSDIHSLIETN